jgi:hypothetical protein
MIEDICQPKGVSFNTNTNTFLTAFHLNANCHYCGGVETHSNFSEAMDSLPNPTHHDSEPSGLVILPSVICEWQLHDGKAIPVFVEPDEYFNRGEQK